MGELVFISYAREDSDFALKLAQSLKERGVPAWVDQLDIKAGQRWDRAIEAALTACSHFLIILSPSSVESDNVGNELLYARDEKKYILPVLHKPCRIPIHLRAVQYADFTNQSYDHALAQVVNLFVTTPNSAIQKTIGSSRAARTTLVLSDLPDDPGSFDQDAAPRVEINPSPRRRQQAAIKNSLVSATLGGLTWIGFLFLNNEEHYWTPNEVIVSTVVIASILAVVFYYGSSLD